MGVRLSKDLKGGHLLTNPFPRVATKGCPTLCEADHCNRLFEYSLLKRSMAILWCPLAGTVYVDRLSMHACMHALLTQIKRLMLDSSRRVSTYSASGESLYKAPQGSRYEQSPHCIYGAQECQLDTTGLPSIARAIQNLCWTPNYLSEEAVLTSALRLANSTHLLLINGQEGTIAEYCAIYK